MGFGITSSVDAYRASRQLRLSGARVATSAERIASGTRIGRGADDAAGLTISHRFRAQALGSAQARRNAQDGISMVQLADGALQSVHDRLHRVRELATRAASDGLTEVERGALAVELQAVARSIETIGEDTRFNGYKLFTPTSVSAPPPPVPTTLDPSSELRAGMTITGGSGGGARTADVAALDVSAAAAGTTYAIDWSGGNLRLTRASDGATDTTPLNSIAAGGTATVAWASLGISITLTSAGGIGASRLRDALTDPANDTIATSGAPPAPAADGLVIGIGPEASDTLTIAREALSLQELGLDTALAAFSASLSRADAASLTDLVDGAVAAVSAKRARLGAVQNRLEHAASYLQESEVQAAASDSRLADADVVAETIAWTRSRIAQQMAAGVLSQAQLAPGRVLTLLTPTP